MSLRAYLLGAASPDEHRRVEEALLADEPLLEQLALEEDDLLDSCARGELDPEAARRFLVAPARRERLLVARALLDAARAPRRPRVPFTLAVAAAALLFLATPARDAKILLSAPTRDAATPEIELPSDAAVVRLEPELPPGRSPDELAARLRRLEPDPAWIPLASLSVRRTELPRGLYRLDVVDDRDQLVAQYLFRIH